MDNHGILFHRNVGFGVETIIPETILGALAVHKCGACSLPAITVLRKCFYLICLCCRPNKMHIRVGFDCHANWRFRGSFSALTILPGIDVAVPSHLTSTSSLTIHPPTVLLFCLFHGRGHAYIFISMSVLHVLFQTEHQLLLSVQQPFYYSLCTVYAFFLTCFSYISNFAVGLCLPHLRRLPS
jgi:hypothetical protein